MSANKIIFILLVLLIILNCSRPIEYPIKIETMDGIKVITNPGYPRDGRIDLMLEEELNIGVEEGDTCYMFFYPSEIEVSHNGDIYISDNNQIKCFNCNGRFLRNIGRKGQGAGEFLSLRFTLNQDGKIYVMDKINSRITILDTAGTYIKDFKILNLNANWHHINSDRNNYIYFSREFIEEGKYMMSIHRYNVNGEELLNYGKFLADQIVMMKQGDKLIPIRTSSTPTTVWIVTRQGKLYTGFSEKYLISVHDEKGKLLFKFGRKYKPTLDKLDWLSGSGKYLPAFFRNWVFDDEENLWIELFNPGKKDQIIYDIFSPEGIYLKQVYLNHRIKALKNGKAFCVVKTENEFFVVKRFRLFESRKD